MRKPTSIFTKTRYHLDVRVWITFITVAAVAAIVFSFKLATNVDCTDFSISVISGNGQKKGNYDVGETISFKVSVPSANVQWNFGDSSKGYSESIRHSFFKPGYYLVTAKVNGKCTESITVSIGNSEIINVPNTTMNVNPIIGPEQCIAGDNVNYTCALNASSYQWTIKDNPLSLVQKTKDAKYKFPTPGSRIIVLMLNNDPNKVFTKTITVISSNDNNDVLQLNGHKKPKTEPTPPVMPPPIQQPPVQIQQASPTPAPVVPKKPTIKFLPDNDYKAMFNEVIAGHMDVESFNEVLCKGIKGTIVMPDQLSVEEFCKKARTDKYRIDFLQVNREIGLLNINGDNISHCVNSFRIEYTKGKGFFDKVIEKVKKKK